MKLSPPQKKLILPSVGKIKLLEPTYLKNQRGKQSNQRSQNSMMLSINSQADLQ